MTFLFVRRNVFADVRRRVACRLSTGDHHRNYRHSRVFSVLPSVYAVEPGTGPWSRYAEDAAAILGLGIIIQTVALFRALSLQGTTETHYVNTVRWFFAGVCVTALSVLVAIYAAA